MTTINPPRRIALYLRIVKTKCIVRQKRETVNGKKICLEAIHIQRSSRDAGFSNL